MACVSVTAVDHGFKCSLINDNSELDKRAESLKIVLDKFVANKPGEIDKRTNSRNCSKDC